MQYLSNKWGYNYYTFFPHEFGVASFTGANISIDNLEMDFEIVKNLEEPLKKIKTNLEYFGYKPGEPKVFIANGID